MARRKKMSVVVDIREYGAGLVQWKIIQTSPHRFAVTQTDRTKFSTEKHHIILGIYDTWKKADQFLSGYIPEALSVMGEGSRLKNPPMTLRSWSTKWKIQSKKHSSGALYIPVASLGDASFAGVSSAERELFRLDDYAVSSVSGGTVWLVSRKKNPPGRKRSVYKKALKAPVSSGGRGWAHAGKESMQAAVANALGRTHVLNPDAIFNWAQKHGVDLQANLKILTPYNDVLISSVLNDDTKLLRKQNPGTKWHRKQEDIHLKKHKGAMSKLGAKYYEGKIHAHQDSIREGWKRKPRRKK